MTNATPQTDMDHRRGLLPWGGLVFVFLFFLVSGMSGLIYEVIWTRVLLNVFGATIYAVSTVLAAFMGGLALGSWLGGMLADRLRRPLRFYGTLELVEGCFAVSVPFLLRLFDPIYDSVYESGETSFLKLSLIRFALSFIALLAPTTIMGATLPILSRFLTRRGGALGSSIGALYSANTAGAVLGTFLAGFVFIALLGTRQTVLLAAAFGVSGGVGCIILSLFLEREPISRKSVEEAPSSAQIPPAPDLAAPALAPWMLRLILFTYGVSGFVALSYQVFWTRSLVFRFDYLKNTTYSFSAMLTVFLIGLAGGSALMSALIDRQRNPLRLYGLIQILIGLSGAFSLFALIHLVWAVQIAEPLDPASFDFNWILAVANVFLRAILVLGLPTFLMGMAFPVAARLCVPRLDRVGSGTGRLYAVNTIGSILGSFASGFVLIPLFGLARGFLVLALINVAIGSLVLLINPADSRRFKIVWTVVSFFALIVLAARVPGEYRFQALGSPLHRFVAYEEGPLATVSVVEDSVGDRTIFVDNVGVAGTDRILLTDQKSLAHVPMLLLENPRSALTVGFGSGGASWSFLQYKELERVDCIEICDTVPAMARYLRASNHGVLDAWDGGNPTGQRFHDGRYRIIVDDVRSYLRFADMKYDVIATDCTDFRYKSNANLYDVEYFELCRDAITDDGMVVVWMPLGGMSPGVFACAMKTFAHVFPDMTIWYMNNEPTHYLLLLGTKKPLRVNLSRMLERVSRPEIQADLREVSLHQAERVLACYVDVATTFEEDWSEAPLNTETRPHLEFESPKYGYGEEPLLVNLDGLRKRKARVSTSDYLEDAAAHPEFMKRLTRFEDANDSILAGHSFVRRLERKNANEALLAACRHYIEALRIAPEDESVQFLLTFDTLRRRSDLWALTLLGEIMRAQGRHDAAANLHHRAVIQAQNQIAQLEAVAARLPLDSPELDENRSMVSRDLYFMRKAVVGLARAYADLGRVDRALQTLAEHELLLDQDADAAALRAEINAGYKAKEVAP